MRELADLPLIAIDESFIDFSDLESAGRRATESQNTIIVKSMGKALGWHGIRLGYAMTNKKMAHELRMKIPYWNINGLAGHVLKNVLAFRDLYFQSFQRVIADREYMRQQLQMIRGLRIYPSKANFLYVELARRVSGKQVRDILLEDYGLIVRECSNKVGSTETYLRLAVHKKETTDKLVHALSKTLPALTREAQIA